MSFSTELQATISSYLRGEISHEDLRRWLDNHAQGALDSNDRRAKQLSDHAWAMHVELRERLRSEEELRTDLAALTNRPVAAG